MATYEENLAALAEMFPGSLAVSPVPGIAAGLDKQITKIATTLAGAKAAAFEAYDQFVAANPGVYNGSPVTAQVWAQLGMLANAKAAALTALQEESGFATKVGEWEANNAGKIKPDTPPAVPVELQPFAG